MKRVIASSILIVLIALVVYDTITSHQSERVESMKIEIESTEGEQQPKKQVIEVGIDSGKMAPNFELQTTSGEWVKLSDFQGTPVIINFWATWCPPCVEEMPDLERFYQNEDVVVLGINVTSRETSMQEIIDFQERLQLTFPILLDNANEVSELYHILPIPTTYFIDENGIIRHQISGQVDLETLETEFQHIKRNSS